MEPKTYTLATLLDMCGGTEDDVRDVLPWHDLRDGGLWLSGRTYGLTGADLATMRWHPRKNSAAPVLPVPFTAFDLAAFFLAGGGLDLYQRFDFDALDADALAKSGSDPSMPVVLSESYRDELRDAARDAPGLLEDELRRLGENADEAREVLGEAVRLRRGADDRFGRTDEGVRKSADWLLNDAHGELTGDSHVAALASAEAGFTAGAVIASDAAKRIVRQDSRLKFCEARGIIFDESARLPDGVGGAAIELNITRQALSADLKKALARRAASRRAGNA